LKSTMSPDLDRKLCETHSLVFRNRGKRGTVMGRNGFECGDGWYALIDAACVVISAPCDRARFEYEHALKAGEGDTVVERARAKMDEEAARVPVAHQVKEKYGSLRIYLNGGGERARAACEFVEYLSEFVCEICGKPGQSLQAGGVLRTRCDEHERD
jgi:hypothetical protein